MLLLQAQFPWAYRKVAFLVLGRITPYPRICTSRRAQEVRLCEITPQGAARVRQPGRIASDMAR